MKYTNKSVIEKFDLGEKLKFVFFWGHQKTSGVSKSCFSQWYETSFVVNGVEFRTSEHYMMAQKALLFKDDEVYQQIIQSNKPGKVKDLGRKVKNFNQQVWEMHRFDIVVKGNYHKFDQNPEMLEFLLNTKDRILVEASPLDTIWGVGLSQDDVDIENPNFWKGTNLLGFALMEARDLLNKK